MSSTSLGDPAARSVDRDPAAATRPDVSLAATSGAHSGLDVAKGLLVGADVVMMTSALLRHGPEHAAVVEAELRAWMAEHDYTSVSELRGSASAATVVDPSAFERANYMATLHSWVAAQTVETGSIGHG